MLLLLFHTAQNSNMLMQTRSMASVSKRSLPPRRLPGHARLTQIGNDGASGSSRIGPLGELGCGT